jgi:NAD-dependent deacetylase
MFWAGVESPVMTHFNGARPIIYSSPMPSVGTFAPTEDFDIAARALRTAENVCVLTGAGISAESGVPTFRDALTGLWSRYSAQELATPDAFADHPDVVWSWYAMRAAQIASSHPNAGHYAIATLARYVPHFTLLTQNVDDLHARAGNTDIVSLHGNLSAARCSRGCDVHEAMANLPGAVAPLCPQCGSYMRPDVVWFGESLSQNALARARAATFACDVFLSVGTSNVVEPAASLPWLAAAHGATVIVVNTTAAGQRKGPSILHLRGGAGLLLSRLVTTAFTGRKPRRIDEDLELADD